MAEPNLADDLLEGVGAIAQEMYGRDDKRTRRLVFYLLERGDLPAGKLGGKWFAFRSKIREHLIKVSSGQAA